MSFLLVLSCATGTVPLVTDSSVSEDEMAVIYFNKGDYRFYPSAVNGVKLTKRAYALKIPAGACTITGDMKFLVEPAIGDAVEKAFIKKDVAFVFDFEAGRNYYVTSDCYGEQTQLRIIANVPFTGTTILYGPPMYAGVDIYLVEEITDRGRPKLKSAEFIESVYFENNVMFGKEKTEPDAKRKTGSEKTEKTDDLTVDEKRVLYEKLKKEFEGDAEK
jgi:hypothetical protein